VGTASAITNNLQGRRRERCVFMARDCFSSNAAIFRHDRPASK
jgi:hypothetical protein